MRSRLVLAEGHKIIGMPFKRILRGLEGDKSIGRYPWRYKVKIMAQKGYNFIPDVKKPAHRPACGSIRTS
jgi:hypothetical protein